VRIRQDARAKDLAMMTPTTPAASPAANAYERSNVQQAASVDASARAAWHTELKTAVANEAKVAATTANAAQAAVQVPDVMKSLSTIAVVGALSSVPAALNMMREIAIASASGTLTDADRRTLQDDYAQLSQKVVTSVGAVDAGAQAQSSAGHDDERDDNAENSFRESSDDSRSTLTRTVEAPVQVVQRAPVEHTVTTQKTTLVADGHGSPKDPQVNFRTHELHVGTDSYEPVSMRQSMTRPTLPATVGRLETHAETRHVYVAQAAQITQFVQVAQTEHVAPLSAVA
jgi:flagellin-like hook-associated protein FlgL